MHTWLPFDWVINLDATKYHHELLPVSLVSILSIYNYPIIYKVLLASLEKNFKKFCSKWSCSYTQCEGNCNRRMLGGWISIVNYVLPRLIDFSSLFYQMLPIIRITSRMAWLLYICPIYMRTCLGCYMCVYTNVRRIICSMIDPVLYTIILWSPHTSPFQVSCFQPNILYFAQ